MNCALQACGRKPRERRLAAARRAPEDHRVRDALRQQAMQRPPGREQVLLAGELGERARPHAVRERAVAGRRRFDRQFGLRAHGERILAARGVSGRASLREPRARAQSPAGAALRGDQPGGQDAGGVGEQVAQVRRRGGRSAVPGRLSSAAPSRKHRSIARQQARAGDAMPEPSRASDEIGQEVCRTCRRRTRSGAPGAATGCATMISATSTQRSPRSRARRSVGIVQDAARGRAADHVDARRRREAERCRIEARVALDAVELEPRRLAEAVDEDHAAQFAVGDADTQLPEVAVCASFGGRRLQASPSAVPPSLTLNSARKSASPESSIAGVPPASPPAGRTSPARGPMS